MCVDPFLLGQDETTENGSTVQRSWSITNASAGKNPCVPIPTGEVYFNTFPPRSAVVIDVGQSAEIEVDALADGAMGDWTMLPEDWTIPNDQTMTALFVTLSIVGGTNTDAGLEIQLKSGDKIKLMVTLAHRSGTPLADRRGRRCPRLRQRQRAALPPRRTSGCSSAAPWPRRRRAVSR